jgi:hypothetical protein
VRIRAGKALLAASGALRAARPESGVDLDTALRRRSASGPVPSPQRVRWRAGGWSAGSLFLD